MFEVNKSRKIINRFGTNVSPCRTPATMSKKSVSPSDERTLTFVFLMTITMAVTVFFQETISKKYLLNLSSEYRNKCIRLPSQLGAVEYTDCTSVEE